MTEGKLPLDHAEAPAPDARRFAEIARREGEGPGAKEMALTRRPRDEPAEKKAAKFLEIERRGG